MIQESLDSCVKDDKTVSHSDKSTKKMYIYMFAYIKLQLATIPSTKHGTETILLLLQLQEKSVLDVMIAASETEENEQLSDNQILSHCLNFLFAAYDTTSLTLTCASHLLATNTHVQDKLCALLDDYWSQHQVHHYV